MKIYNEITDLIGNTPMVRLKSRYAKNLKAEIAVKLEMFNPLSSVKDRIGFAMIREAEKEGKLVKGGVIVEPTSGNTGIALSYIAAARGYKIILTMPDTMSIERRKLMKALGAELVLTEGVKGMKGAISKAEEIAADISDSFIPSQFDNKANPAVHRKTTGVEIWNDTDGLVGIFVAGVGTGGTISGAGGYLKEKNSSIKIVAVEPEGSPVMSGGNPGPHKIQGIGAGFIPDNLDMNVIDEVVKVNEENAGNASRQLARDEGILAGISSGAALSAAYELASRDENEGKLIVVLLPDTGERYLSTWLFEE